MDNENINFFFRKIPIKILLELRKEKEIYGQKLSINTGCTYSHVVKIINKFEEIEIVERKKKGRKKILNLTKKGEEIADKLNEVIEKL